MKNKIPKQILENVLRLVLEQEDKKPFSLESLKQFHASDPEVFDKIFDFLDGTGLKQVGKGAARTVFSLDGGHKVLKVAQDWAGLEQNKAEMAVCGSAKAMGLVPEVFAAESDPGGLWIVQEQVKPATPGVFKQIAGFDLQTAAMVYHKMETHGEKYLQSPEAIKNYGNVISSTLFHKLIKVIKDCDFVFYDILKVSNWGVVDGRVVIVDTGFTNAVNDFIYANAHLHEFISSAIQLVLLNEDFEDVTAKPTVAPIRQQPRPVQIEPFSLEKLNSIDTSSPDAFRQVRGYIDRSTLRLIGRGQGRFVYDLGNGRVLKVATDPMEGVGQNKAELNVCQQAGDLVPLMFPEESDKQAGLWVVQEFAKDIDEDQFGQLTEMPWQDFSSAIKGAFSGFRTAGGEGDPNSERFKQAYINASNNPWFKKVERVIHACDYMPGDVDKIENWGLAHGKPVIRDTGFTRSVAAARKT